MLTVSPQYEVGTDEETGEANKLQEFAQGPKPVKMGPELLDSRAGFFSTVPCCRLGLSEVTDSGKGG